MKKTVFIALSFLTTTLTAKAQPYLYGVNLKGNGAITKYDLKANSLKAVYDLSETDGDAPYSGMIKGANGLFYGVTSYNGSSNYGTLFSFNPESQQFSKLYDFNGIDGGQPVGSPTKAANGKLYGLTVAGGAGSIYSFDPAARLYRKLYTLTENEGEGLYGSLVQAADGKLYGLTFSGGGSDPDAPGLGTLFAFDPNNYSFRKLLSFEGNNGANPFGSLVLGADNKLYGTTHKGGVHDAGVLFSFDPKTTKYNKLHDFDGTNGAGPYSNLLQASDGLLYGTTKEGGSHKAGIVFAFNPAQGTFKKLHEFNINDGADPSGTLIEASNKMLYGTTEHGGQNNLGVLYELDPKSQMVKTLQDYDGINGKSPHYGALVEMKLDRGVPVATVSKLTLSIAPNPSASYFNLFIEHHNNQPVELRVFDAGGKLVEAKKTTANSIIQIGHAYTPGTYFATVIQGNEKATVELIKK